MNNKPTATPRIPDASLCLFRKDPGGSRNGKIVLCRVDAGGGVPIAVVKRYQSVRQPSEESLGAASKIILSSINTNYDDIELTEGDELRILGIYERVISENATS